MENNSWFLYLSDNLSIRQMSLLVETKRTTSRFPVFTATISTLFSAFLAYFNFLTSFSLRATWMDFLLGGSHFTLLFLFFLLFFHYILVFLFNFFWLWFTFFFSFFFSLFLFYIAQLPTTKASGLKPFHKNIYLRPNYQCVGCF